MTAHEIHALSGAYTMDALDDIERARFEGHLAACAECQAEVASLQDTAALFSTMSATAPSAALRSSILAEIKTVRPLPPVVARLEARRPRRWSRLVAAAAVLGVVGGGAAVWQQNQGTAKAPVLSAADQIMTAADVSARNYKLDNGATAKVYRSASLGKAAIVAANLPKLPAGKAYELWLREGTTMLPAGQLKGSGDQTAVFAGDASEANGAGITVEQAGSKPKTPTIPVYAIIKFEKQST
jgi:hypothetical protein